MKNFHNFNKLNFERKNINKKLEIIKNINADPNNVILNSAAIQDQLLIDMGIKKKKSKKISRYREEQKTKPIPNILQKILKKELDQEKESEILIRQKNYLKSLTLAQKVGLKEINQMPLSLEEWKRLESQTLKRDDHKSNCPICLESLFKKETLILSCSHVFHKICQRNFEKFANSKKCPICRCKNYESKDYFKDKEYFININIVLIQKIFRGYLLRLKLYRNVFKYEMPKNKHLRALYSNWKIKDLTSNMCRLMEDKFKESHKMITNLVKEVKEISNKSNTNRIQLIKMSRIDKFNNHDNDWKKIFLEMKKRKNDNCAICLGTLVNKTNYLLNCTHCFHKNCLDSFERFDSYYERRCPICRNNYEKKEIHNDLE